MKKRLQRVAAVGLLVFGQIATCLTALPLHASAMGGSFEWISRSYTGGILNDNNGAGAVEQGVSSDGRYVLFSSYASNVVPNDTNGFNDIFRRDRLTGTTELVSVSSAGAQGNADVLRGDGSISGDGRYVVFASYASNLTSGGSGSGLDIFMRDMQAGTTTRICTSPFGGNDCTADSISRDGRYVSYRVADIFAGPAQVFRYDRTTGQSQLVSQDAQGQRGNQSGTVWTRISADGRYVVFDNYSTNLVPGDTNNKLDIFRKDMVTGEVVRVNTTSSGVQGNGDSEWPTVSDDGRYVVFSSTSSNFAPNDTNGDWDLFIKDIQQNTLDLVGGAFTRTTQGTVSSDGQQVVFSTARSLVASDTDTRGDVYRWDYTTHALNRLTEGPGGASLGLYGASNGNSSVDGRYTLIITNNMIDPGDTTPAVETYLYDSGPLDTIPPTVVGTPTPLPNAAGWNNSDVTINWAASDPTPSSGTPTTPPPVVANQNGIHTYTSAPSCDPAGNCATGSLTLKIDTSSPTVSYDVSPAPNATGWNNGDVVITFVCDDAVSGIASCSQPVTLGEGADQTVTGTAIDYAGNSTSVQVTVNVDKTAPTISYSKSPDANAAGWNNSDVTVGFSCADAISTIAACTDPVVVGEGANQTITGTAVDRADNSASVSATVSVDKTAPTISYSLSQAPNAAGWNTSEVTVTFACDDALSGVASCSNPVTVGEGANQVVTGTAVDVAGNTKTVSVTLNVDTALPTISYTLSHQPSLFGWDNADVIVTFACSDALSGVVSCSNPVTVGEGANQVVAGTAVDAAGNTATTSVTLNVDTTKPMVTYGLSSAPNAAGWFKTDVTVNFQCLDFLSGVYLCSDPVTLTNDGADQTVSGSVTDQALNTETVTTMPINIDKTAPTLSNVAFTTNPLAINQTTTLNAQVGDATSGVSRVEYFADNVDPGAGNGTEMAVASGVATATVGYYVTAGMHTFSVRVQDVAGNWSPILTVNLDVYDPVNSHAAAHGLITPNGATSDTNPGDYLPTVTGNNIKATLDITLGYATPADTVPTGSSTFTWGPAAHGNCKKTPNSCFVVEATSVDWLIVPGNGTADFQGLANVSLNGSPVGAGANYPFRVHLVDDIGTGLPEHYQLRVYPIGSNPSTAQPVYQASGDLTGGFVTLLP